MSPGKEEERRRNRPYRRFIAVLFAVLVTLLCILIFRGVMRTLDRLPSADGLDRPDVVDVRALRACAEDLERLETQVRKLARQAFTEPPPSQPPPDWLTLIKPVTIERLKIVARCRLDEDTEDPAAAALRRAATAIEDLESTYGLLYGRYLTEVAPHSETVHEAAKEAALQLQQRK